MKTRLPDYGRSNLALANSVLAHFGVTPHHETEPTFDQALCPRGGRAPRSAVILLFDGLGMTMLEKHLPARSFLRRHLVTELSAVFPPTTVAATSSIQSGLTPLEHGRLGWFLWFPEAGENYSIFMNEGEESHAPYAPGNPGELFLHYENLGDQIRAVRPEVEYFEVSPFGSEKAYSAAEVCRKIRRLCRRPGERFLYGYWTGPDHDVHDLGTDHPKIRREVRAIDRAVRRMCRGLRDAAVAVTADHGLLTVDWVVLDEYPELLAMLRAPYCSVESRACALFVKEECLAAFPAKFNELLGGRFRLFSREEALRLGLFGPGEAHPRAESFLGDFLAAATDRYCLSLHRDPNPLRGQHAGLTEDEMRVPFILIQK